MGLAVLGGLFAADKAWAAADAQYISQTVPTILNPGETASATIKMKNTGNIVWNGPAYPTRYYLGSQNPANNTTWGINRVLLPKTGTSEVATITFNITAPTTPGNYTFQWQVINVINGSWIGEATPATTIHIRYPTPTCSYASPDNDYVYVGDGTRMTYAYGITNATMVRFHVWSEAGGTDDETWAAGSNQGGGVWTRDIILASHPGQGLINVVVYLYNSDHSAVYCDTANFYKVSRADADIKANGSNAAQTITYNTAATISWTSVSTTSCSVSPTGWTGTSNAGISTGNLTSSTTYTVSCSGLKGDTVSDSVTVNVGPAPPAVPSCSSAGPDGDVTYATTGTRSTYAYGVANATSVLFQAWSEAGGTDDVIWYTGVNQGGGTWKADVNLASHSGIGTIFVNAYMANSYYTSTLCDSANFSRVKSGYINVSVPSDVSWTLTGPNGFSQTGTGPLSNIGPVSAGAYTLTPANKPGYDVNISPSASQTLQ